MRSQDSNSCVFMLQQEVRQSSSAIRGLLVRPAQDLLVGCDMVDRASIGFDRGGAGQEYCRGELVDVVPVVVGFGGRGYCRRGGGRAEMSCKGGETLESG